MNAHEATHWLLTVGKGVAGIVAPVVGVVTSMQEQLLYWLRVSSLVVGMAVGVVTIWSLVRRWKR